MTISQIAIRRIAEDRALMRQRQEVQEVLRTARLTIAAILRIGGRGWIKSNRHSCWPFEH